jgi:thiamine-phosphate pyrophosphorylase
MSDPSERRPDPTISAAMEFHLPKVYPITDLRLAGISHAEQVLRLVRGGATLVQLREKDLPSREFYLQAEEALRVARSQGVKIIVNDRVDVALAIKADGVHLGQDDLPPESARRLLGDRALIGYSTHNLEQARNAAKLPVNYLAVGPIFATRTKRKADPAVGLEGLSRIRAATGAIPLVAIGGITSKNAAQALSMGADAVAVIGELFSPATDIERNLERLRQSL